MQSVSSRIWTPVAVFISYDDNNYTTGTSKTQFIMVYANHTILTPPRTAHLVVSKISTLLVDQNWYDLIRSKILNPPPFDRRTSTPSFQNPKILRAVSSGRDVIYPLSSLQRHVHLHFLSGNLLWHDDCHILSMRTCERTV